MTTSFNAKAKALRGKISGGNGTGKRTSIPGMRKLNLSQVKKHLKSEARASRGHDEYNEHLQNS